MKTPRDIRIPETVEHIVDFLDMRWDSLDASYVKDGKKYMALVKKDARVQISLEALLQCFQKWAQPKRRRQNKIHRWTSKEIAQIEKMRGEGKTYPQIAEVIGMPAKNCRNIYVYYYGGRA